MAARGAARGNIITGIDIGTTKICTLIADISDGSMNIIGVGKVPSRGLKRGLVVDLNKTTKAIEDSVSEAERMAGYTVDRAYVGVTGHHISSMNSRGVVSVSDSQEITVKDRNRVVEAAQVVVIPQERRIIHVIDREYFVDGQGGIRNPVGMAGARLEVDAHIITGAVSFLQNMAKCVQRLDIEIVDMVLEPLASGTAVLYEDEKDIGVILLDIGGGTTDLAVFLGGSICFTKILPIGGSHIDRDITVGLSTSMTEAERLKCDYGCAAVAALADEGQPIEVRIVARNETREIPRKLLCEIMEPRVEELLGLVADEIDNSGYKDMIPAGAVLTGGGALLSGIGESAQRILNTHVRTGSPVGVDNMSDRVASPIYATAVGLLQWGLVRDAGDPGAGGGGGMLTRMLSWIRNIV